MPASRTAEISNSRKLPELPQKFYSKREDDPPVQTLGLNIAKREFTLSAKVRDKDERELRT